MFDELSWKECPGPSYDLTEIEEMLARLGARPVFTRKKKPESAARDEATSEFISQSEHVDVEAQLAAMTYQGPGDTSVNNTLKRVIPSLLHRGEHPDDVLEHVVGAVMEMAARCGHNWDQGAEVKAARGRILSAYNNLLLKDYDPATSEIPAWLPGEFHMRWSAVLAEGCNPCFGFNRGGFYVRNPQRAKHVGPEAEPAPDHPAPIAKALVSNEPPPPKKYRFPMLRFNEMQLGTEANYVVDELIPTAGLVLIYGAPKSGKSFWAFDLTLHVALGWEYRERAVQQGTIIYCAFEGAHGYRKRKEAFRMHHMLTDEDPPLYIVPGRADLIKEHAALIRELHEQVARDQAAGTASTVRAVVLDTLNKSLIGSESKDVDMANYIAAAEAIQKAFGCVVIIVHHHGIDESRPRGHTSLRGAVDTQIKIVRDEQNTIIAEIEDMRDGPEGAQILSRLAVVTVGEDCAGRPVTSAAIEPVDPGTRKGDGHKLPHLTRNQRTMFSLLDCAPDGLAADEWSEQARAAGIGVKRRADLVDLRNSLRQRGLVFINNGRWYVVAKFKSGPE